MNPHYHIEVAHLYAGDKFSDEHARGLEYARHFVEVLGEENCTLAVMVDDYHSDKEFDRQAFVDRCALENVHIHEVYYESDMAHAASYIMNGMDQLKICRERFGDRYQQGFRNSRDEFIALYDQGNPTCALLSASFMMVRYHSIHLASGKTWLRHPYRRPQVAGATKLLTILPSKYMRVESKVRDILLSSTFTDTVEANDYVFFN